MATKKKPAEASEWRPEKEPDEIIDPDDAEIDLIFADFPQNDTCIELFRVNAQGGRPMFLEQVTPAMFSFSYVCEKFGGGKYFARGKYKGNARAPVRLPFEIEGEPFPVRRSAPARDPLNPERQIPVDRVLVGDIDDGHDNSTALVSMMRLMLSKMENNEEAFLRKMELYKNLFVNKQEAPLETAISMFTKGLELAGNSSLGETNPWLMLAREFKEPLGKIVDTVQMAMQRPIANVNPPHNAGYQQPTHTATQPTPVTQPVQSAGDPMIEQAIRFFMPVLVNGAAKNADPGTYADLILDQLPRENYNSMREWLLKPDCLDSLSKFEPGIRFQQEWWSALRGELIAALNETLNVNPSTQSPEDSESTA